MTNKNLHSNKKHNPPFLLKPDAKDYLWGGNRLNDDFAKGIELSPLAETWECSVHPDGLSVVASGEFQGMTLAELLKEHREFLGSHSEKKGELPILIKLIDAKKNLSVQVHPDDEYAMKYENGQSGKTEMWYVMDCEENTELVYGLLHDTDKELLRESISKGTIERLLQKVPVRKDDVFFIEAGTIHAIGAGALIAEIQENSNLTYRLYDYNRVDRNGIKRELHVEKALEAADLTSSAGPVQSLRVLKYRQGCASELLCRCRYFEVYRMLVNTERCRKLVGYQADSTSFRVLLCIGGCGSMVWQDNGTLNFFKGDCVFVPAESVKFRIHGKAEFLDIRG